MKTLKCIFCNGSGKIAHYHHIENGKCFRCNGTGSVEGSTSKYQAKCYCGKKGFTSGDSAKTVTEIDSVEGHDIYFHDDKCMGKYFNDIGFNETFYHMTTFQ